MNNARAVFIASAVEARKNGRQLDGTPDSRYPEQKRCPTCGGILGIGIAAVFPCGKQQCVAARSQTR